MIAARRKREASPAACTARVAMRLDEHARDHRAVISAGTILTALVAVSIAACGHNIRRDFVGRGVAGIKPRGNPTIAIAARSLPVSAGTYAGDISFELPRPQLVDWNVSCPGMSVTGSLGETARDARERRRAEIVDERQRASEVQASVATAVLAPTGATIHVRANPYVQLPAADSSFHRVSTSVDLDVSYAGTCVLTATTDDPDVAGSFELSRVRDLDAEAHAPELAAEEIVRSSALASRHRMIEVLVADGAWLDGRARRLAVIEGECHGVRDTLRRRLVALGAVERTPKPEPIVEDKPAKPFASATWIAGAWTWTGARWTWVKGGWRDPRTAETRPARPRHVVLVRRPVLVVPPPPTIVIPMR